MLCPLCHTMNRDNAKFCKGCGRELVPTENANETSISTAAPENVPPTAQPPMVDEQIPPPPPVEAETVIEPPREEQAPPAAPDSATAPQVEAIDEDLSLLPTQILSPDKMVAYQARRWQDELEREQPSGEIVAQSPARSEAPGTEAPTVASMAGAGTPAREMRRTPDIADMPTVLFSPGEFAPVPQPSSHREAPQGVPANDSAETVHDATPPNQPAGKTGAGDVSPSPTTEAAAGPQTTIGDVMEQNTPAAGEPQQQGHTEQEQGIQEEAATAATPGTFPVLEVGAIVAGRYEITQVINADENEHIYQVIDHQGYQHCWNCGSEQNAQGDEFCIDCGAELSNATYLMHEYTAASNSASDASVLPGTIINTFVDQGYTYVIAQPQTLQSPFPNGVHLLAASDSDAGDVRRSEPNEDSTLVLQLQRVHESIAVPAGVFIVADGLGGHENGQVASRLTIGTIAERILRELLAAPLNAEKSGTELPTLDEDKLVAILQGSIEDANAAICEKNQRDKSDMGSTITGFMIVGEHSYILNVGDSRTYMLRDGNLYQLTNDHSLVGQLVASGMIEPDDVYTHPQRSQIYRSLGDKLNVQIDIFKQQLQPGDVLLSCSDGLWEMVRNPQIADILKNAADPQSACTQLIDAANANGGEDNVSAVVVFAR